MKEITKVLLIQPPSRASTPRPPLGLMYISSCLSREGIDNDIIDVKSREILDIILNKTLAQIKKTEVDIIGITCLVTEIEIVNVMCEKIKEIKPDSIVVLGGAQPTNHPEHFIDARDSIDYFVIGEGEITFTKLVKAIRKNVKAEELKKIDGLAWFEGKKIERSKSRELIKDLNKLPLPAYDKVNMNYYIQPTSWGSRPVLISLFWIFSSRGCPYKCKFCVAHEIFGKTIRQRNPKNVVDEIEYLLKKYKIDGVYFYDDIFTISPKRTIEICDELIRRKIKIVWGCQTRVNLISEEVVKKMGQAGCLQIDFGIESGSDRILRLIQKDITVAQIREAVRICKKYNIRTFANMMANLPTETNEDLNASINLMKELNCNVVVWNVMVPYPGCFLDRELSKEDYRKLMGFPSDEAYALLEKKYKLAKYDIPLKKLVDKLYNIFAHPRYIHFKLSLDYIKRWVLFIDFIFKPKYIITVLRSKRKLQYIKCFIFQPKHN